MEFPEAGHRRFQLEPSYASETFEKVLLTLVAENGNLVDKAHKLCLLLEQAIPGSVACVYSLTPSRRPRVFCAPNAPPELTSTLLNVELGLAKGAIVSDVIPLPPSPFSNEAGSIRKTGLVPPKSITGLNRYWSMPVIDAGGVLVGRIGLAVDAEAEPSADQVRMLDAAAHALGLVIRQNREQASEPGRDEFQRLLDFNALLVSVSELIAESHSDTQLLQGICELAVRHARLKLAWIGMPDAQGRFTFIAAAGEATGFLEGLVISAHGEDPAGQGSTGRTWREGRSYYHRSFGATPFLHPWLERAARYGINACASLPITRHGRMWAVMSVYHGEPDVFENALQDLLGTLAVNISRGLDRLDLHHQEHQTQTLNQAILDGASFGVILCRDADILFVNPRALDILGRPDQDWLAGKRIPFPPEGASAQDGPMTLRRWRETQRSTVFETSFERPDGSHCWLRFEGSPFEHERYNEMWTLIDVTAEREAQDRQILLAHALSSVHEGVLIVDCEMRAVYVNDGFVQLTGYSIEDMQGRNYKLLQGPGTDESTISMMRRSLARGETFSGEVLNYRKDGSEFWNLVTINPLRDDQGEITHYVCVQRDITTLRSLSTQLEYQAYHDALTGLPNRRALEVHLAEAIARAERSGRMVAVGLIDLDDFKLVNEHFGHDIGDRLLQFITRRWQALLQPQEYLARVGGDEMAVVIEDVDPVRYQRALEKRLELLHGVVEQPVALDYGVSPEIALSMGVALFPNDAQDAGVLMRLADGALHRAKQNKAQVDRWWEMHGSHTGGLETDERIDPYGAEAAHILADIEPMLRRLSKVFVDSFYEKPPPDKVFQQIIARLPGEDLNAFKRNLSGHLCLVLGAQTTRRELETSSRYFGRVRIMVGIEGVLMLRIFSYYRQRLFDHLNSQPMVARQRYRILQIAEQRLQDDVQVQLTVQGEIQTQFVEHTIRPWPEKLGTWSDAISQELTALGKLPGIKAALLIRQSSRGVFKIEASAGPAGQQVADIFRLSGIETSNTSLLSSNESLMSRTWHTGVIQSSPAHALEQVSPAWDDFFASLSALRINSSAHVPVLNDSGRPVAVITLMGSYPNQFESIWSRQFARNLQQRWGEIWLRCTQPPPAISQEQSILYRQRLFGGGLRMFVQPVVDLQTGRCVRVEALARLVIGEGQILGPGIFLPLLGDAELDRIFRLGLEQVLPKIAVWDAQGLKVGVSLNLPPRTLLDADCALWVKEALERHGVPAERLALELLETEEIDPAAKDAAIERLLALGVKLVMDDLGSGFSSLKRLASVPFDTIKVDQGLLARVREEPVRTLSLVSSVIQMGVDFGQKVVVEGLEDAGMIEAAVLLGANLGQGYGLARPMPMDNLVAWSRHFKIATKTGRLETPLGALAFHWRESRNGQGSQQPLASCPLTLYLRRVGAGYGDAVRWHGLLHKEPPDPDAARQLMDALVRIVRQEAPH